MPGWEKGKSVQIRKGGRGNHDKQEQYDNSKLRRHIGTLTPSGKQPCASLQAGVTFPGTGLVIKDLEVFCSEVS